MYVVLVVRFGILLLLLFSFRLDFTAKLAGFSLVVLIPGKMLNHDIFITMHLNTYSFLSILLLGGYKCYRNGGRQKILDILRDQQIQRHTKGGIFVFSLDTKADILQNPKQTDKKINFKLEYNVLHFIGLVVTEVETKG